MAEVDTSLEELLERYEWHAKTNLLFSTSASVIRPPDLGSGNPPAVERRA
jgi:hypothetical protein